MKTRFAMGLCLILVMAAVPALQAQAGGGGQAAEAMPTIPGKEIARKGGGFLGLEIVDGNFKLSFYDEKKKPVAANVARGTARWDSKQKLGRDFTVLNPGGDNLSLFGTKFVRPPYNFIVFVTLLDAAGEAVENYPVNMMN